jgi:predicted dehydrogenase
MLPSGGPLASSAADKSGCGAMAYRSFFRSVPENRRRRAKCSRSGWTCGNSTHNALSIDALCCCLGEFKELSSVVANQRQQIKMVETGEMIQLTAPDQMLISGVLQSDAVASIHLKGGTASGTGFLFEIHGTEGALAIVPADPRQATYIQVSEFTVRGAQAGKPLAHLSIPESYRWVPPAVPAGLPFNVAPAVHADG